jgi:2-polyprenyl-3-methyl-5-hydroxy-6-metoxy-1,4-benzoquinol methylase
MAELTKDVADTSLLQRTVPLVDGLHDRLSMGIDVADIGCGGGCIVNLLAREYPRSRFVGFDFSDEAIAMAKAQAAEWGLSNVRFEVRDAAALGEQAAFDVVTSFDAIHDQAHPATVVQAISAALRPGGVYLCVEPAASTHLQDNMDHPLAPTMYTMSTMHCMTVSLAYGGEGLGTMWGEEAATRMLQDAGFAGVTAHHVEGDFFDIYLVAKRA